MNAKHLACLVIVIVTVLFIQVVLEVRKNLAGMQAEVDKARTEAEAVNAKLQTERSLLAALQKNSASIIEFLKEWEPTLARIKTPEAGELSVSGEVKRSGIITLAQRFESEATKIPNIPKILRSNITVEDDYAATMNWLGSMEKVFPASRVSSLNVERGQSANDIRVELVLDVPLVREEGVK